MDYSNILFLASKSKLNIFIFIIYFFCNIKWVYFAVNVKKTKTLPEEKVTIENNKFVNISNIR
jgi:hypothetical protein